MEHYSGGFVLLSFENVDDQRCSSHAVKVAQAFPDVVIRLRSRRVCLQRWLIQFHRQADCRCRISSPQCNQHREASRVGGSTLLDSRDSGKLAEIYNCAAVSVRAAGENLETAYLEFVGSLANALDARDQYTAGHSSRVSQLSCATASAMGLGLEDVERIRIGALLHDMGKIGIADNVLQKVRPAYRQGVRNRQATSGDWPQNPRRRPGLRTIPVGC